MAVSGFHAPAAASAALVLHGVQEMREPSEEASGLGERFGVAGPSGQDRGVGEGGGGRRLGRFGDREDRRPGPGERLDADLPVHGVDQYGGVEPDGRAAARARRTPPGGHPASGARQRPAGQQPVPVGHMVTHLGRGEHQRDGGGEPGPLTLCHGRGAHATQRARSGRTPHSAVHFGLSLRQNGDKEPVVVRHDPRELTVVPTQREAQPAQMRHPLTGELVSEPMTTGPDDSEHDVPPWFLRCHNDAELPHRTDRGTDRHGRFVHPYAPRITHTP